MDFELITVFPDESVAMSRVGVTGRALHGRSHRLRAWNPRDYADGGYRRVDDRPYGGGPGMVMLAEPLHRCLKAIRAARHAASEPPLPLIYLSAQGQPLRQARVRTLASGHGAILLCGRYEAIDQRFQDAEVDEEISVGDFVASGGELPALLLIDAVLRLVPGTLNDPESALRESFSSGLLDHPHFTRPETWEGHPVPPILLSGDHEQIARWRQAQAEAQTALKRPDLFALRGPATRDQSDVAAGTMHQNKRST